MTTHHFLSYKQAVKAHDVALSCRWIVRIGFDAAKGWWVEYVGRAF